MFYPGNIHNSVNMKILIAYYSFTGNTAKLANALAAFLNEKGYAVSIEEVKPEKPYSKLAAYTVGCKDAMQKKAIPIKQIKYNPAEYNCIAVLSPTWAWTYVPPVTTYLSLLPEAKNGQLAIAGSTGGSAIACKQIASAMEKKGYAPVSELWIKSFPTLPKEDELKKQFASLLKLPL